jgi:hypothetical protein
MTLVLDTLGEERLPRLDTVESSHTGFINTHEGTIQTRCRWVLANVARVQVHTMSEIFGRIPRFRSAWLLSVHTLPEQVCITSKWS